MKTYKVKAAFLSYHGQEAKRGETIELPEGVARHWEAAGYIEETTPAKPEKPSEDKPAEDKGNKGKKTKGGK